MAILYTTSFSSANWGNYMKNKLTEIPKTLVHKFQQPLIEPQSLTWTKNFIAAKWVLDSTIEVKMKNSWLELWKQNVEGMKMVKDRLVDEAIRKVVIKMQICEAQDCVWN